jgi:hypothetical protein
VLTFPVAVFPVVKPGGTALSLYVPSLLFSFDSLGHGCFGSAGGGAVLCSCVLRRALEFFPLASCLSLSICAQGELLHLFTSAVSSDPGRESRVLSSEVDGWHGNLDGQRATTA